MRAPPQIPRGREARAYLRFTEAGFNWVLESYASALRGVLRHPAVTMLVLAATISVTVYLYIIIPKGFFPEQDTGRMSGSVMAEQNISFQAMRPRCSTWTKSSIADPDVASTSWYIGGNYGGGTNSAHISVVAKDLGRAEIDRRGSHRAHSPQDCRCARRATYSCTPSQDIRIGGRMSNAAYQFTLQSQDLDALKYWAPIVYEQLKKIPDYCRCQQRPAEQRIAVLGSGGSRYGFASRPHRIADRRGPLRCFRTAPVSTMYTPLNQYHVVMEVAPKYWQIARDAQTRVRAQLQGDDGAVIAFAHFLPGNTPLAVAHQGVFPSVTISFSLPEGVALGEAVDAINEAELEMGLPVTVHRQICRHRAGISGFAEERADSGRDGPNRRLYRVGHAV